MASMPSTRKKGLKMPLKERLNTIEKALPSEVTLVVVSKFHSPEEIMEAYEAGVRNFGENLAQELIPKYEALPKDIHWHYIGGLQRNKVRQIISFVDLIHSVDSVRLYEEIVRRASMIPRCVDILFQVHIAQEETKGGFAQEEAKEAILALCNRTEDKPYRRIRGLMGMATLTEDSSQIKKEFSSLKKLFEEIKAHLPADEKTHFDTLSMGMSSDWELAVEEGSNLVRIGTAIMGKRRSRN